MKHRTDFRFCICTHFVFRHLVLRFKETKRFGCLKFLNLPPDLPFCKKLLMQSHKRMMFQRISHATFKLETEERLAI